MSFQPNAPRPERHYMHWTRKAKFQAENGNVNAERKLLLRNAKHKETLQAKKELNERTR